MFIVFIFTLCAYIGHVNNVAANWANKRYINVTLLYKMPKRDREMIPDNFTLNNYIKVSNLKWCELKWYRGSIQGSDSWWNSSNSANTSECHAC